MSTLEQGTFEQNQPQIMPIALRNGLIASLALIAVELVNNLMGYSDPRVEGASTAGWISWILNLGIVFTFLFMSIRQYRSEAGGQISFGRAFSVAGLTGVMLSLVSMAWAFINLSFIDTGAVDMLQEVFFESMSAQPDMDQETAEQWAGWLASPGFIGGIILVIRLIDTLLFSLIGAAILQNENEEN